MKSDIRNTSSQPPPANLAGGPAAGAINPPATADRSAVNNPFPQAVQPGPSPSDMQDIARRNAQLSATANEALMGHAQEREAAMNASDIKLREQAATNKKSEDEATRKQYADQVRASGAGGNTLHASPLNGDVATGDNAKTPATEPLPLVMPATIKDGKLGYMATPVAAAPKMANTSHDTSKNITSTEKLTEKATIDDAKRG